MRHLAASLCMALACLLLDAAERLDPMPPLSDDADRRIFRAIMRSLNE